MAKNKIQFQEGLGLQTFTSGTIFAYTKLPLTTWFLAIYFVTQSKVSVSAISLKRTIGVSYNTALLMKYKIQQVMKEPDESKPLTPVHSKYLMKDNNVNYDHVNKK